MIKNRPIKRGQQGPAAGPAVEVPTGGDDLSDLIAEVEGLRVSLGFARLSALWPWCDDPPVATADRWGLECLVERLSVVWVNRGGGVV